VFPITTEEFATILQAFPFLEDVPRLAVACSGGPDSLALTLLLHEWTQSQNKQVIALTVDHGLRADSAQEALQVQQWLRSRGISHEILSWQGDKPKTRVQETAREMRYQLLSEWCQKSDISVLMTAHHAQDQAETFLMRLAKGSGLRGLCAMRPVVERLPVKIVRPLLMIPPERLRLTLTHFQQSFIEDPSNENRSFERVRWRQAWQELTQHGLTLEALLTTIGRLQESQSLIDIQLAEMVHQFLTFSPYGYLIVDWKGLQELSREAIELFIGHILWFFSGQGWQSKHQAVKALCLELEKGQRRVFTLGGAIIQIKGQQLMVFRELRAAPLPQVFNEGTHTLWWDERFWLNVEVPQGETLTLKPLGSQVDLPDKLTKKALARALSTLPSFWHDEDLFFLPTDDNNEKRDNRWCIQVRPHWKFTIS